MDPRIDKHLAPAAMRGSDETIDVRRYIDALRRARLPVALLVIASTVTAVLLSSVLPKTYEATARLVFEQSPSALGSTDATTVERDLATTDSLLTTPQVLQAAATRIGGGITRTQLRDQVTSTVDDSANIINVTATSREPKGAAAIANGVSEAFIAERVRAERDSAARARAGLLQEIKTLQGQPNSDVQISAIRQRLSELTVALASSGSELQIAEHAEAPSAPVSPRPFRNGVLAFVAALFLGILLALGRDMLVPRIGGARDLSRLTRLTVLAGVPYVHTILGRRPRYASAAEDEGYQTLRAWVELELPSEQTRLLLLTSAVHSEGKTTATARLGQALAEAGYGVLLVSADLRRPTLHQIFGIDLGTGTADIIEEMARHPDADASAMLDRAIVQLSPKGGGRSRGALSLVTSGSSQDQAVRSLTTEVAHAFYEKLRQAGFDYVLIDGPPLLGIADSTVLAQEADDLLIVARLDRLTVENAVDLRELLGRLTTPALGLIAIGTPSETSPYYLPRRTLPPSTTRSTPTRT